MRHETPLGPNLDLNDLIGQSRGLLDILKTTSGMGPAPTTDPLMQIGAILAGFGAGTQGKANPVTEMLMRRQEQDVSRKLALAQLGLTARGQTQTRAHQERMEGFEQQRLDTAKQTMEASFAEKMLAIGKETGNDKMVADALGKLVGNMWPQYDTKDIAAAVSNKTRLEFLEKNSAQMVLDAALNRDTPELKRYGQNIVADMRDATKRAALLAYHKIPEPGDARAEMVTKRNAQKLQQDRIDATNRVQAAFAEGRSPDATDMLLANKELSLSPEAMTVMALSQHGRGSPVSGVLQTYLDTWDRQQKSITTAHAAQETLTQLHNLQIKQAEKSAPIDEITALLKMLQTTVGTVTALEGSLMPQDRKTALLGRLAKMIETQAHLIEKTTGKTQAFVDMMSEVKQELAAAQKRQADRLAGEAAKAPPPATRGAEGEPVLVPGSPADRAAKAARALLMQKRQAVPPEYPGLMP